MTLTAFSQKTAPLFEQHLNQMRGKKILVVGDLGLDRYTLGSVDRISPEGPVPIVCVQEERLKLGLAANVAENIQVLGGQPYLVGVLGDDANAQDFKKLLKSKGIHDSFLIQDISRRTILKERVMSDHQQLLRIDYESIHLLSEEIQKALFFNIETLTSQMDAVILEDYAKGTFSQSFLKQLISLFQKENKLIAIDPNRRTPLSFYQGATLLTPNTQEAEALSGLKIRDEISLNQVGQYLLQQTHAQYIIITRGKEGMALFKQQQMQLIPTYAHEVYDVSGAGDTVIAVLTLALITGASLEQAAFLGNVAAGIEVGKRGTATVSPEEILMYMPKCYTN